MELNSRQEPSPHLQSPAWLVCLALEVGRCFEEMGAGSLCRVAQSATQLCFTPNSLFSSLTASSGEWDRVSCLL